MTKHRHIVRVVLITTFLLTHFNNTTNANSTNWPQFRGPGSLGVALDNQTYPTTLDVLRNLLWKIEVAKGHSSPCIWGDNIFITARSGKRLETICVDRGNGNIKWRKSVVPENMEKISNFNSNASSTPACDGENVYIYFGSFGLLAYDVDGTELWRKPLPIPNMEFRYGSAASPVLTNNMVVINCDPHEGAYILAVNKKTGETIWKQDRQLERDDWSTPVLWKHENEQELIVRGGQKLISYDPKDGHKRWWIYNLPRGVVTSTPVYQGDTLFVTTAGGGGRTGDPANPIELPDYEELIRMYDIDKDGRLIQAEVPEELVADYRYGPRSRGIKKDFSEHDTNKDGAISKAEWETVMKQTAKIQPSNMDALFAIRNGGKDDVSRTHVKWTAHEGIGQVSSPLFYQGRIYLVKHGGNVTCYDSKTGAKVYGDKLGSRTYYLASPVAADGKIYFCSLNGSVIVVQAGDKFKIFAQNKIKEHIYATPALVDGKVYLRTDKCMYAFDKAKTDSDMAHAVKEISSVKAEIKRAKTLHGAATDGDIELVKSLIAGGADVNSQNNWGWTPLHSAIAVGHNDVVSLLIAKGADVNISNEMGLTPLQFAINNNLMDIVRLLIENGANYRVADKNGVTLLHSAIAQDYVYIAETLIEKGADVNAKNRWSWAPLHLACQRGHKETVKLLIDKGADINTKNRGGLTPLHIAAQTGQKNLVELLIAEGADVNAKNMFGGTPLRIAENRGYTDIVEMLRKHGAKE